MVRASLSLASRANAAKRDDSLEVFIYKQDLDMRKMNAAFQKRADLARLHTVEYAINVVAERNPETLSGL